MLTAQEGLFLGTLLIKETHCSILRGTVIWTNVAHSVSGYRVKDWDSIHGRFMDRFIRSHIDSGSTQPPTK
jgi:hypothetical protein